MNKRTAVPPFTSPSQPFVRPHNMKKLSERRRSFGFLASSDKPDVDARLADRPQLQSRRQSTVFQSSAFGAAPQPPLTRRQSIAQLVFGSSSLVQQPPAKRDSDDSAEEDYLCGSSASEWEESSGSRSASRASRDWPDKHTAAAERKTSRSSGVPACMGRAMRVVVCGAKRVGKTAILRQVACLEDITQQPYEATLDDTYQVLLEEADRPREILVFHDTAGLADYGPVEIRRPYVAVADAFVLVYSVTDHESFNRMDQLKKLIDRQFGKEKKEVPIVVLGNKCDLPGRKVESDFAASWAAREKVKLYEVSATNRDSLVEFVHFLGQRHFHPQKESKFSLTKKLKSEKSNAAILMDF